MQTSTLAFIILAAITALGLVLLQYYFKSKKRGKLQKVLSFFRFLALFSLFLLLINPKFVKNEYHIEKANLILLTDNSSSMATPDGMVEVAKIREEISKNTAVSEKFVLQEYNFGTALNGNDSVSFSEKSTNITKALATIQEIYGTANSAVVVLTDGNQTLGEDYEFYGQRSTFPLFPVAIGDTTQYEDLRIGQINTNTYAFLKNKYPIEAYIAYEGKKNTTVSARIVVDGQTVFRENLNFSNRDNTKTITAFIDANTVGVKTIQVMVDSLENEKNTDNNIKNTAIEVIDEKTNIAIISSVLHPDIGTLKKAIERNEQRSATIYKPNTSLNELNDTDVFILYQPTRTFAKIYEYIQKKKANILTITGTKTDWNFVNSVQNTFKKNNYNQKEEIFPILNAGFDTFGTEDFSLTDFPPLMGDLGGIMLNDGGEVLLHQRIKGVNLNEPLLALMDNGQMREAMLFGENIWKWRIQSFRNDQAFDNFDDFIGKLMLYLATTKSKNRLTVDYQSIYAGSNEAKITASYFDETFVFDGNATITVQINAEDNDVSREIPMLMKGNYYESDLSGLPAGVYNFTVKVANESIARSGGFTILDFDVEKQFLSSNYAKLDRLAAQTSGKLYFPSESNVMIDSLLGDNRFLPIQKGKENVVSLIDFKFLMGIIIVALTLEWFIRKYNGLI